MAFMRGQTDVLLCTTIIESGLDIPTRQHDPDRSRRRPRDSPSSISCAAASGAASHRAYAYLHDPGWSHTLTGRRGRRRLEAIQDL